MRPVRAMSSAAVVNPTSAVGSTSVNIHAPVTAGLSAAAAAASAAKIGGVVCSDCGVSPVAVHLAGVFLCAAAAAAAIAEVSSTLSAPLELPGLPLEAATCCGAGMQKRCKAMHMPKGLAGGWMWKAALHLDACCIRVERVVNCSRKIQSYAAKNCSEPRRLDAIWQVHPCASIGVQARLTTYVQMR